MLKLVAISSSRRSSWPRDRTWVSYVSCIVGRFFTVWATREAHSHHEIMNIYFTLCCKISESLIRQQHILIHPCCVTEKAMAPHSSTLAWRIPGTGEPGGLPSMGSHRVGHDWSILAACCVTVRLFSWDIASHVANSQYLLGILMNRRMIEENSLISFNCIYN